MISCYISHCHSWITIGMETKRIKRIKCIPKQKELSYRRHSSEQKEMKDKNTWDGDRFRKSLQSEQIHRHRDWTRQSKNEANKRESNRIMQSIASLSSSRRFIEGRGWDNSISETRRTASPETCSDKNKELRKRWMNKKMGMEVKGGMKAIMFIKMQDVVQEEEEILHRGLPFHYRQLNSQFR